MLGADRDVIFETEAAELRGVRCMLIHVDLVDDEDERLVDAAQSWRASSSIDGCQAVLPIDDEKQHVRGRERDLHLGVDLVGEAGVHIAADAAGVDDLKRDRCRACTWR